MACAITIAAAATTAATANNNNQASIHNVSHGWDEFTVMATTRNSHL